MSTRKCGTTVMCVAMLATALQRVMREVQQIIQESHPFNVSVTHKSNEIV